MILAVEGRRPRRFLQDDMLMAESVASQAASALRHTVENGMLHSLSRALHEEVQFDTEKVTSVDWVTHPSLTRPPEPGEAA